MTPGGALNPADVPQVVLALQADCNHMSEEQLGKMAVSLLNCHSAVEGRTLYPCYRDMVGAV